MASCIPAEVLEILRNFVSRAREVLGDVEVYLFGSYARCTWVEDSDIDLIIVSSAFEGLDLGKRYALARMLLPSNRGFEILTYTRKEFEEAMKRSMVVQDASEYWVKVV